MGLTICGNTGSHRSQFSSMILERVGNRAYMGFSHLRWFSCALNPIPTLMFFANSFRNTTMAFGIPAMTRLAVV
jgi:hypothetical protein